MESAQKETTKRVTLAHSPKIMGGTKTMGLKNQATLFSTSDNESKSPEQANYLQKFQLSHQDSESPNQAPRRPNLKQLSTRFTPGFNSGFTINPTKVAMDSPNVKKVRTEKLKSYHKKRQDLDEISSCDLSEEQDE